jgi:hypothetical protein
MLFLGVRNSIKVRYLPENCLTMVSHQPAIIMIFAAVILGLMFQTHEALAAVVPHKVPGVLGPATPDEKKAEEIAKAPVAVSGNNIYITWNNASATLHDSAIFFTKSNDGGKTFANTMVLSPPNTNPKISVIRTNVSIDAADNNVAVTWWTNETGSLNPVIRTSSDGGNTFANLVMLNSALGGINK